MAQPLKQFFTPDEYFELESSATYKSEYFQGEIFMMAGASANHDRISLNVTSALNLGLKKSCEVFSSDIKVQIDPNTFFTYPDASVVCGKIQFAPNRDDMIINPLLIVEVISPTTEKYDRGRKFQAYRTINSLKTYLMIEQERPYIEVYERQADGNWLLKTFEGLDTILELPTIEFELSLTTIYNRVEFETVDQNRPSH